MCIWDPHSKGISLGVMHFSASEEMRANDFGASDVFRIIWMDNSEIIRSCPSKRAILRRQLLKLFCSKNKHYFHMMYDLVIDTLGIKF